MLPNASDDHGHMRRDLRAGTVTLLFTDVEGSTKLLHELGAEAYAEALAEHRRLIGQQTPARELIRHGSAGLSAANRPDRR
jgi:class 3 adenylate cyclase